MIKGLNHITLAVSDVERSLLFYSKILGFSAHVVWDGGAYLSVGELWLCLSLDKTCEKTDYTHFAFSVTPEKFKPYCDKLIVEGVVQWKENSSEGGSLYFLDPDGHKLEVHSGSLESRLESLRSEPYKNMRWL